MPHSRKTLASLAVLVLFHFITGCGTGATTLEAPVFSPSGGTFTTIQTVEITAPNGTGVIHYTTDGSTPTLKSPVTNGTVQVATPLTLRAYATSAPANDSPVTSASFVIHLPAAAIPDIRPDTGVFNLAQTVTITDPTAGASIYYTTDGSAPTLSSTRYTRAFTVSSNATVRAIAIATGYSLSPIATSAITIVPPPAATPVISPRGGSFATAQTVTLTDATAGALLYYTVDGSIPTASSTRYTAPFPVSTSSTVRVIATASGYLNSAIAQASFNITTSATRSLSGTVQLSKAAVAGAVLTLYTPGTTGYGSAATVVSTANATADTTGQFSLNYTCSSATIPVYLVSRRGTPAGRTVGAVSQLVLVTALGPCGSASTTVRVNEVTTVAAAYALAQFPDLSAADGAARIGASSTNAAGISRAFLTANVLANPATGLFGGPSVAPTTTWPGSELDTLAAITASCGATTGSTPCAALLSASTFTGLRAPTDSFMALVNIARHPSNNVTALFNLSAGGAYTPLLSSAPADWTVALNHAAGGINQPTAISIDASGNVWIADFAGAISKLSPQGAAISGSAGYTGGGLKNLYGLTIDPTGNVWVSSAASAAGVNSGHGAIQKFSSTGALLSGATGFGGTGVDLPQYVAADALGNIWVANSGNSTAAELSTSGALLTSATGLGSGSTFVNPTAIAIDATNGAWFANGGGSTITRAAADRSLGTPVTCCSTPYGIALDPSGNLWVTNYAAGTVSQVHPPTTVVSAGYSVGSGRQPQGLAIDGAGNVWTGIYTAPSGQPTTIVELAGDGGTVAAGTVLSGANGFGAAAQLTRVGRLAIDGSGNLWVTNFGGSFVTEFVGAAAPVKTPLLGLPARP